MDWTAVFTQQSLVDHNQAALNDVPVNCDYVVYLWAILVLISRFISNAIILPFVVQFTICKR